MLYIVPTPIGNLKDITLRALEVLESVEGIICEDTRRTSQLLTHFKLNKPLIVLNDFNEVKVFPQVLQKLIDGANLALVSDAGTPLISDPGYKLVRACIESEVPIDSLPGPSSILPALTLSGLPPDKFLFLGYLPEKPGKRVDTLQKVKIISTKMNFTVVVLVSPHKLERTLHNIYETLGDIKISLAHEISKIHQSVDSKLVSEWLAEFKKHSPKGEFVLLFNLNS